MKFRNLLLTGLAALVVLVPTNVFAEEVETEEKEWRDIRLEQVSEFTPENLGEWTRLFDSKDILKAERDTLRAELEDLIENVWKPIIEAEKDEIKVELDAYKESLKLDVTNEVINLEEAKVLFEAFRLELTAELTAEKEAREAEKLIREENKVYYDELRAQRENFNQLIKAALETGDTTSVAGYLNEIMAINQELESHAIDVNAEIQNAINKINEL